MLEPSGILVVNKPSGVTSHDVVGKIRRLYKTKKVGHTGTLDPMATGVLVLLIGRSVKASEYATEHDKIYKAGLKLGITTDTEDITGALITQSSTLPDKSRVLSVLSEFRGDIMQIPPMYSALKVNGKKLCDLARAGITVEREARQIRIHSLEGMAVDEENGEYTLTVSCSKGTYIRTLCADIGAALGCGGVMSSLQRVKVGDFSLETAVTLEELEKMTDVGRISLLRSTEMLFSELKEVVLPEFFERLARCGNEIYQNKIGSLLPVGERVRLKSRLGDFFALAEVRDFPEGTAIKAIKLF